MPKIPAFYVTHLGAYCFQRFFQFDRKKNFTHCVIFDDLEEENLENITKLASEYNISLVMFDWLKTAVVKNSVPRKLCSILESL